MPYQRQQDATDAKNGFWFESTTMKIQFNERTAVEQPMLRLTRTYRAGNAGWPDSACDASTGVARWMHP